MGIQDVLNFDWSQVHVTAEDFTCEPRPRERKPTDPYVVRQDPEKRPGKSDNGEVQEGIGWVIINPFDEIFGEIGDDWIYSDRQAAQEMADYLNNQQDAWAEDARKGN